MFRYFSSPLNMDCCTIRSSQFLYKQQHMHMLETYVAVLYASHSMHNNDFYTNLYSQVCSVLTHIGPTSAADPQTETTEELTRTITTFNFSVLSSSFTKTTSSSRTDSTSTRHKQPQFTATASDNSAREKK